MARTRRISVKVDPEMAEQIRAAVGPYGSMNEYVNVALREKLSRDHPADDVKRARQRRRNGG